MKSETELYIKEEKTLLYKLSQQMDDQTSSVLVECLDTKTTFNYLNYYCQKMLTEIGDEVYALKSDTLYEWWWQQEGSIPGDYDGDE